MISKATFLKCVMALPEIAEAPHFEHQAFKVKNKIVVTLNTKEWRCCVNLSVEDQELFCLMDKNLIYPVPNKWGKHGWTLVNLKLVNKEILTSVLTAAYIHVAPPKLAKIVSQTAL